MYSPQLGTFVDRDPIESDPNLYRYCGNRPMTLTDPSGMAPQVTDATWIGKSPGVKWSGVAFGINYQLSDDLWGSYDYQVVNFTFTAKDKAGKELTNYSAVGKSVDLGRFAKSATDKKLVLNDLVNTQQDALTAFGQHVSTVRGRKTVCSMQVSYNGKWQFFKDTLKIALAGHPDTPIDYNPTLKYHKQGQVIGTLTIGGKPVVQQPLSAIVQVDPGKQAALYEFSWSSSLSLARDKPESIWKGEWSITFNFPQNPDLAKKMSKGGKAWSQGEVLKHSLNK